MENWLKENWFKLSILILVLFFGTWFFKLQQNRTSNIQTSIQSNDKASTPNLDLSGTGKTNDNIQSSGNATQSPQPTAKTTPPAPVQAQPKSYPESWISETNGINAWAYDNNNGYTVALTFMSAKNPSYTFTATSNSSIYNNPAYDVGSGCNGDCYQEGSFLWQNRSDAAGELRNEGVNATNVYGFTFVSAGYAHTDPSVPKDDYILIKATYNGKAFNLPATSYSQRVCGINENGIQCFGL